MSITSINKDTDQLSMTVTADYDVTADRAWQLWADPRQLERWWGPPTYPATVAQHDLREGGHVAYSMTGPEGDRHHGWWSVREVEAPRLLVIEDGFADETGAPNPALPTTLMRVEITDRPGGVTVTISSRFPSLEAMEELLRMGMEEGLKEAMGQIDAILAGEPDRARS
jgi:uncharacterized protein YndB with AHSA1/START domain